MNELDLDMMREAVAEAELAAAEGELPVGCVIVKDGRIIARGHNEREQSGDPTDHAEIVAIRKACELLGTPRLTGCDLYVTLEPCAMCTGAIINARIRGLYIGAMDKKAGCCGSVTDLVTEQLFNHKTEVYYGIMEDKCSEILTRFFKERR